MNVGQIGRIEIEKPRGPEAGRSGNRPDGPSFGEAMEEALREVETELGRADAAAVGHIAGDGSDLHNVLLEMERADLSLRTLMQVRNKLLDAYREIMRMQV
ncbi:MAG: flagellar hook-basal body complex protein FliE [Acidobacteria bacterium]|nr:MAG: flagellar hook-basal body complex protein FliE [Acidobacteriota bacterium]